MDDGFEVACMLRAHRASSVVPVGWPEGFSIPEQPPDDDQAHQHQILNHQVVIA